MAKLTKRHKDIIDAFWKFDGAATLEKISQVTGLSVNGLSQSMKVIEQLTDVEYLGGDGGNQKFRFKKW